MWKGGHFIWAVRTGGAMSAAGQSKAKKSPRNAVRRRAQRSWPGNCAIGFREHPGGRVLAGTGLREGRRRDERRKENHQGPDDWR